MWYLGQPLGQPHVNTPAASRCVEKSDREQPYDRAMSTEVQVRLREAESRARVAENVISAAAVLDEAGIPPRSPQAHRLFHRIVRLPDERSMRRHVQGSMGLDGVPLREAASAPTGEARKRYTQAARELLAKEGKARPDGSYPIRDAADVEQAVFDFSSSKGSPEDKAWIVARAKAIPGGTDALPADWSTSLQESVRLQELGVPTLDGGRLGRQRLPLREPTAAGLAERGIPLRAGCAPPPVRP